MVKLIAVYEMAADLASFESHYRGTHMPLAMRLPGLRKCELGWVRSALGGEPRYHLVAELYFDDNAALDAALRSPEGAAAAEDVSAFAGRRVHLMIADAESFAPR